MIIPALKEARARGVTIRIALDPSVRQAYDKLAEMADVVRIASITSRVTKTTTAVNMARCDHNMCAKGKRWFCSDAEAKAADMRCDNPGGIERNFFIACARASRKLDEATRWVR